MQPCYNTAQNCTELFESGSVTFITGGSRYQDSRGNSKSLVCPSEGHILEGRHSTYHGGHREHENYSSLLGTDWLAFRVHGPVLVGP